MTIEQALIAYGRAHLTQTNDWYHWRNINPRYLPTGIVLPEGNQYAQNISLKNQLAMQYSNGDDEQKISVTRYYIAVWGGVRRNSIDKIIDYSLSAPENLIATGTQGIASWSKALCIRDPNTYAIYDARVALSLNAIQAVLEVDAPVLYPLLTGQNKLINRGSIRIHKHASEKNWPKVEKVYFYQQYNKSLAAAASALKVSQYTLEMLLFAHAPILLRAAFPNEQL